MKYNDSDPDAYAKPVGFTLRKAWHKIKSFMKWSKERIAHKLRHLKPSNLLDILAKHGLALVVIIVVWEIIEDVVFPIIFAILGNHVHPAFYAGIPASLLWGLWMKISNQEKQDESDDHGCC
jgi:hypothetical protein